MKLDNGEDVIYSSLGGILSFLLMCVTILFAYQKYDVLVGKKDVDILSSTRDSYFTDEDVFDYKNGFAFAVAFTAYDDNPEIILEPKYGSVVFNHFRWGGNPDGSFGTQRDKIEPHYCSREELGLEGQGKGATFLPVYPGSKPEVDFYAKKFQCVDKKDYAIYGDYNSARAQ